MEMELASKLAASVICRGHAPPCRRSPPAADQQEQGIVNLQHRHDFTRTTRVASAATATARNPRRPTVGDVYWCMSHTEVRASASITGTGTGMTISAYALAQSCLLMVAPARTHPRTRWRAERVVAGNLAEHRDMASLTADLTPTLEGAALRAECRTDPGSLSGGCLLGRCLGSPRRSSTPGIMEAGGGHGGRALGERKGAPWRATRALIAAVQVKSNG